MRTDLLRAISVIVGIALYLVGFALIPFALTFFGFDNSVVLASIASETIILLWIVDYLFS